MISQRIRKLLSVKVLTIQSPEKRPLFNRLVSKSLNFVSHIAGAKREQKYGNGAK